ncbi:MAG TPA: sigma-70 family RNA polymerase sigma factor, partial [Deltaproteobacteria bacterium]|nr:sigma-70 family RNA polymerase sigma factor [Deltaproteobacteria bacterium]
MKDDAYGEYQRYNREIQRFEVLDRGQEYELAKRYRQGDRDAGEKILRANLRHVVRTARKYFNSGYPYLEIIQEGNLGLMKALTRYDPDRGIPFFYYAVWWVESMIRDLIQKGSQVHTGSLEHAKKLLSLNNSVGEDENDRNQWIDFLAIADDPERVCRIQERSDRIVALFEHCFTFLTPREADIIKQRFYADPPLTLQEIGERMGVSRERVRQLQIRSMEKLKQVLEDQAELFLEPNIFETLTLGDSVQA